VSARAVPVRWGFLPKKKGKLPVQRKIALCQGRITYRFGQVRAHARSTGGRDALEDPVIRCLRQDNDLDVVRKILEGIQVQIFRYVDLRIEWQTQLSNEPAATASPAPNLLSRPPGDAVAALVMLAQHDRHKG